MSLQPDQAHEPPSRYTCVIAVYQIYDIKITRYLETTHTPIHVFVSG